jgi:hypothetical protein
MSTVDEIEDLRAELRHCHLTALERKESEARLAELIRQRNPDDLDHKNCD